MPVSIRTNQATADSIPIVTPSRADEGTFYTRISSLLSGIALLALFLYQMLLNYVFDHGGAYLSDGIVIASMIMLSFSAVFGFYGARLLHSRAGIIVPVISAATLLSFFIQWEWCLHYCVVP